MKFEIIDNPSEDVFLSLSNLQAHTCLVPGCSKPAECMVALKNKNELASFENSIILCQECAAKCKNGELSIDMFKRLRSLLKHTRIKPDNSGDIILSTRRDYITTVNYELANAKSIRCVYVGPLPFHPEWYFQIRVGQTNLPSMDQTIYRALTDSSISVKIILRNDDRYLQKVHDAIPDELIPLLIPSICENFNKYVNDDYNNTVIFLNTGVLHIPIITDTGCVFASRGDSNIPIEGGLYTKEQHTIKWESDTFDKLIQMNLANKGDVNDLKAFLDRLLV